MNFTVDLMSNVKFRLTSTKYEHRRIAHPVMLCSVLIYVENGLAERSGIKIVNENIVSSSPTRYPFFYYYFAAIA